MILGFMFDDPLANHEGATGVLHLQDANSLGLWWSTPKAATIKHEPAVRLDCSALERSLAEQVRTSACHMAPMSACPVLCQLRLGSAERTCNPVADLATAIVASSV